MTLYFRKDKNSEFKGEKISLFEIAGKSIDDYDCFSIEIYVINNKVAITYIMHDGINEPYDYKTEVYHNENYTIYW